MSKIPGVAHMDIEEKGVSMKKRKYKDKRGWKYKVMSGMGANTFKARYQKDTKTGPNGWKGVAALPWRETEKEAQSDLNTYAESKGWEVWE